jgi:hypothetical protein
MLIVAGAVAVVAWGALAFGAVYPWAFTPLLIAAAATGALGAFMYRRRAVSRQTRLAFLALVCVLAAGLIQVIPLPPAALSVLSPSADAFLRNYDLAYSLGAIDIGRQPWHPLSLAPRASLVGLGFLAAFTLFLAGLTRALSSSRARALAALIVAFGVVLAIVGIVQKVTLGDHAWGGMKIYGFWAPANRLSTPFGPFINKNHFAGWMLMALPLALGVAMGRAEHAVKHVRGGFRSLLLWFSSPQGGWFQMSLLAALTMAASLLMTRSRCLSRVRDDSHQLRGAAPLRNRARRLDRAHITGHSLPRRVLAGGSGPCGPDHQSPRRHGAAQEHLDRQRIGDP